jgi:hypothetical protein
MYEKLLLEAKRCENMVEVEVNKVKVEMDKEIAWYRKKVEIGEIKLHAVKKNYQTILVCSWIICLSASFFFSFFFLDTLEVVCMNAKLVV